MLNPLLNVQDLPSRHLLEFKHACLDVLTAELTQSACLALFDERPKLVQSMYFDGNPATWAHQDTYYLDSEHIGKLSAAWFAMEDIQPGAGRFFVYPRSHLIDVGRNSGEQNIAFRHDEYKRRIIEQLRELELPCHAPALGRGDVLFWSSTTIHGSLPTTQPEFARPSLTAHYIPESHRFLQFQKRIRPLSVYRYNGMQVHSPKNQDELAKQAILKVETTFPRAFRLAKKVAVRLVVR
jgi:phytanoyl-CoA hydroxylase